MAEFLSDEEIDLLVDTAQTIDDTSNDYVMDIRLIATGDKFSDEFIKDILFFMHKRGIKEFKVLNKELKDNI